MMNKYSGKLAKLNSRFGIARISKGGVKVLGISGSPRRGGNSEILLDQALGAAASVGVDTEKIVLNELEFSPCQECAGCEKDGNCIVDDEMQAIYQSVDEAGAVILASPIFFGSLSAQTKAMIDRYQCRWVAKEALGKITDKSKNGYLILTEGSDRENFFKNAESIVKNFFAVLSIRFAGSLYCPHLDQKGEVLKHPDCLREAFQLGKGLQQR